MNKKEILKLTLSSMEDDEKRLENPTQMAQTLNKKLTASLGKIESRQTCKMTDAIIDSHVEAYQQENYGANNITGSADKRTEYLREKHPEIGHHIPQMKKLDLHLSGGKNDLVMESELHGAKAARTDLKKLEGLPPSNIKSFVTRIKNLKSRDQHTETIQRISAHERGSYIYTEIYLAKNKTINYSRPRTLLIHNGNVEYDSEEKEG